MLAFAYATMPLAVRAPCTPTHGPELSSKTVLLGYQGTLTRATRTGTEWVTAAIPDLTVDFGAKRY
jgi:hypothetical protein